MSTAARVASRAERVAQRVAERELDSLLVSNLVNVRWLCGFTGTNGLAIVGADGSGTFITDFRYVEQAEEQVEGFEHARGRQDLLGDAAERLSGRVGFDDGHLSVRAHRKLEEKLGEGVELVPAGGVVEGLREVKEETEVEAIRAAAALADEALSAALSRGLAGRTERDVARDVEDEMRRRGAREPSFPSIVAAGAHGALPHAEPRDVEIVRDALVIVDWGAELDGYCSDCTRTFATGAVGDRAREVYELVLGAQVRALEALRPGVGGKEADAVAREEIAAAGHEEEFGHGLGHGVGLEVHEGPRMSPLAEDVTLTAGNVLTVEPGVYLPGELGVRIEDLVVLRENGAEVLSSHPKELTVVE